MSPVLAAKQLARELGIKFSGLVRVLFDDPETNQHIEEGRPTGYDTLVMVSRFNNGDMYLMFVDIGTGIVPAYLFQYEQDEEITDSAAYGIEKFALSISKEQAKEIFDKIKESNIAYANGLEVEHG
ncbi:hypothetical protein [Mongoliitalea daihaiensis]|uniref:hypothetical protein n=1 Tax=Mongoliitalea daihaiensis TaxID=2782006 RepID=UPI001F4244F3|nr:hypothetical protein [Mongoliitalea daihaiensis]UJP64026.1 hypothetical protein IPZ59_14525 [Mongoliitalea daihaiensis]